MPRATSRIILGTAQFGLNYGVANAVGQPGHEEVRCILKRGRNGGITAIDTAIAYGGSEQVLGQANVHGFDVISKLPKIPDMPDAEISAWVDSQIQGSLSRLGLDRLDGLLLHRPEQLLEASGPSLYRALQEQISKDSVCKIGISIYDPSDLDLLIPEFDFDIVQAPLNILDSRLLKSGWMERLKRKGVELHVRSVFLQGLLLMHRTRRPAYFERWAALWDAWDVWLDENHLTPLEACLRYILHADGIEKVVLGVDSERQLNEILTVSDAGPVPDGYQSLQTQDINLLNPSLWKLE
ncbi:MAG: aldo/keto reductase [Castellaniella sp.]|uniref:aldo/keto reductase n=1 Tax=Castellaniella sp. TaxID=1955812 RepID=UPI003C756AC2